MDPVSADDRVLSKRNAVARRKRMLRPFLHPMIGRKLPQHLQPAAAYVTAEKLAGGVGADTFLELIQDIDQGPFHADTELQAYFTGEEAFAAMLEAVRSARHELMLEAYIISSDRTGHEFLEALSQAVQRGVAVYVLADAFGSSRTHQDFWTLMRRSGSQFRLFRKPRYVPRALLPILDHRKLLVVDRRVAFTGGMNIADEYRIGTGGAPAWRDTHVRVTGTIAWECAMLFAEGWEAAGGDPLPFDERSASQPTGARALLLDSRPGRGAQEIHSVYAALMGGVRHRLWITNAYFAPGAAILDFLKRTAQRGIDVRLLVPRQSDLPIIKAATQGYYAEMLAAGIRVFEYLPQVLHAKTLIADEHIGVIGSTNFDFRSFDLNYEANILIADVEMTRQMIERFETDLAASEEILAEPWARRPWWLRAVNWLARLLAPVL